VSPSPRDLDDEAESEAESDAYAVAMKLAALPERDMRVARLREILTERTAEEAAWLLDALATAGRAGGPPFDLSLLAAVDLTCGDTLPYAHRRAIFEAARARGLAACEELLMTDLAVADTRGNAPRPLVPGTRPLTLGERKSLARSWRRDVLERLLADPHAEVVALLLANPHLTQRDILCIATSRRSSPRVLHLVLGARRWGVDPRVRRALVRNPNLPTATALRLVGLLNRIELEELARDPHLSDSLAAALHRRLRPPS
jgi:hypothetical protein